MQRLTDDKLGEVITQKLNLNPNEQLLLEGSANKWQTFGSKGGKLFLTNQRLVFIAHMFNFGSKFDEILLSNIATSGNTFKFKVSSNLVSFNIDLETKSGEKIGFVVTRKQKDLWIEKIGQAIFGYVSQNISVSENNNSNSSGVPQIKVVNCEGCGYYVIVMGGVAKCECCGRPTV